MHILQPGEKPETAAAKFRVYSGMDLPYWQEFYLLGEAEAVAERIRGKIEALGGVDHLILNPLDWDPASIEVLAERVLPLVSVAVGRRSMALTSDQPTSTDALGALAAGGPAGRPWVVLAGATDHYPARVGRAPVEDVLDITAIGRLRGIEQVGDGWRIGALTTWTDLVEAPLPPLFDGLKAAAVAIGGQQIQARATIAGNVCNASPAADGVPNLMALDAVVELASVRGQRGVPVTEFISGNRRTVRAPDELVTGIVVKEALRGAQVRSSFEKLGSRAYLVISIAMVATVVEVDAAGQIARARVAVGACSEVAQRLPALEAELAGRPAADVATSIADVVRPGHLADLQPIDDVRGTAAYRREAALELVRRGLVKVLA